MAAAPSTVFATKPLERLLHEAEGVGEKTTLKRTLSAANLVALGIGAIIGAGIFTLTGHAANAYAGPAIVYSFLFSAFGCALAGFCYSEFATMIPIAGSAYTYAYATMGELLAWIIGWDLVLEYALGAATVAIGWSGTLVSILHSLGINLPPALIASPWHPAKLPSGEVIHGIINLPALLIVVLISLLLIVGIEESAKVNSIVVAIKVAVVVIFIAVGWSFIDPSNHTPFIPANQGGDKFGWPGIFRGASAIFFAYIGFDAVSTAAQEAKNPKRDMPIGIIGSLLVCTLLFIGFAWVLTGVVNYTELNVSSPVALAVDRMKIGWLGFLMKLAVLAGLTSVMLVMLLGQSRVFFSMSRDGLLMPMFSQLHPRFRTPYLSNIVLMIFVGIFASFFPIDVVGEMTNIGTLFAFVLVSIGIIIMRRTQPDLPRPFRTPLVPFLPIASVLVNFWLMTNLGLENWLRLLGWLGIGLAIYLTYGRYHSRLAK
ncbi:MAG: amino acid permease [Acidobacteria bacterium]|nr:amino acid permease [Acidobacteriota bacterium]